MSWIKTCHQALKQSRKLQRIDKQLTLILLLFIPCLVITGVALLNSNISSYLTAFILIVLLLLCVFSTTGIRQQSQYQIRTLSNLIESMIDGDYSLRGRLQADPAFQELLNSINDLASTLSSHKMEAKQSRLLLERIIEHMDAMILATNAKGYVVMANSAANKLILNTGDDTTPKALAAIPLGNELIQQQPGLVKFTDPLLSGEHLLFKEFFLADGERHQLFMLTNAERLLMEKERSAWQSLLRVLSHEINNSLAPIIAISQSMGQKLTPNNVNVDRTTLLDGITIVSERANSLSHFIASYSQLYHLPKPTKTKFTLHSIINGLTQLYPLCQFDTDFDNGLIVSADRQQFEQVLINIFKNAVEAMIRSDKPSITITSREKDNQLHIIVRDYGAGVANSKNLFVPFYTTKPQGCGIGLTLCRQILFNHDGSIKLRNHDSERGAEVILTIPASVET